MNNNGGGKGFGNGGGSFVGGQGRNGGGSFVGGQGRNGGGSFVGGQGRNGGGSFGAGGFCVCAKCGEKVPHCRGVKCTELKCPSCNHTMVREELLKK